MRSKKSTRKSSKNVKTQSLHLMRKLSHSTPRVTGVVGDAKVGLYLSGVSRRKNPRVKDVDVYFIEGRGATKIVKELLDAAAVVHQRGLFLGEGVRGANDKDFKPTAGGYLSKSSMRGLASLAMKAAGPAIKAATPAIKKFATDTANKLLNDKELHKKGVDAISQGAHRAISKLNKQEPHDEARVSV